jgi:hypoxanthine phosphoribosyltransferase
MPTTSALAEISEILFTPEQIQQRVRELGREITREYKGRTPTFVGVLKGSMMFLADLMRAVELPMTVDFVVLSSYDGQTSTGVVKTVVDLGQNPKGKDLLVVEDIVDTGLTLNYLVSSLRSRGANSVEICALLDKRERRKVPVTPKYAGFQIPDKFVVGYGLDYNERYRNLPYVGILNPEKADSNSK